MAFKKNTASILRAGAVVANKIWSKKHKEAEELQENLGAAGLQGRQEKMQQERERQKKSSQLIEYRHKLLKTKPEKIMQDQIGSDWTSLRRFVMGN